MIEVFKTNVTSDQQATDFINLLAGYFPSLKINFDLSDCDHILRIEGAQLDLAGIRHIAEANSIFIEPLE